MKKITTILLSLALVVSCLSLIPTATTAVLAEKAKEAEEQSSQKAVNQTAEDEQAEDPETARRQALREMFLEKAEEVKIEDGHISFTDAISKDEERVDLELKSFEEAKVAILYPSYTVLWYEAGGEATAIIGGDTAVKLYEKNIGRDITQDEGVTVVADSSAAKNWSVEQIIASQPDLIICATAMSGYETIKVPAAAAEIPVIAVDYDDFADYLKWFKVFAHLSGHPEAWEEVAQPCLEHVIDTIMVVPEEAEVSFLNLFLARGIQANTNKTVSASVATHLGGENIVSSWDNPDAAERLNLNLETVFKADPEIIIIQAMLGQEASKKILKDELGDDPVWNSLTAVKEGKVYVLDSELFHQKANRHFDEAYRQMALILYPELEEELPPFEENVEEEK